MHSELFHTYTHLGPCRMDRSNPQSSRAHIPGDVRQRSSRMFARRQGRKIGTHCYTRTLLLKSFSNPFKTHVIQKVIVI